MTERTHHTATETAIARAPVIQRACSCGEAAGASGKSAACASDERLGIQPKLSISRPGDRWEQEADRIADQIVSDRAAPLTGPLPVSPLVQRQVEEEEEEEEIVQPKVAAAGQALVQRQPQEEEEEEEVLQSKSDGTAPALLQRQAEFEEEEEEEALQTKAAGPGTTTATAPPPVARAAAAVATDGRPLAASERAYFEPRFGRDLSAVRLHDGPAAARAARGIGARAYTLGQNIAFAPGQSTPGNPGGRQLIAHELVHTIQQSPGAAARTVQRDNGDDAEAEQEDTGPVTAITMSCTDMRMRLETARRSYSYTLDTCSIPLGSYTGSVSVTGDNFELTFGTAYEDEGFEFSYRVDPGEANPASLLAGQESVPVRVVEHLGSRTAPARHVNPEIANLPAVRYVDAFSEVHYDLDYRAEGGNLSTWLTVTYADGARIDINVNDIADRDVDMVDAMANGRLGPQGRIFPSEMTRTTVPRLWAARQEAIAVMEEYNYEFIVTALPAVLFIITLAGLPPLAGSRPVVRRHTRPRPVRPPSGSGPAAEAAPAAGSGASGRVAASGTASGGAASAAGGVGGSSFRIVGNRVLRYSGRDIVVVETSAGRQAFYRRTGLGGRNAGGAQPGQWAPFDGVLAGWFHKARYAVASADDALYRFGTLENRASSEWLGRQAIRAGDDVGEVFSIVNQHLDDLGALRLGGGG